MSSRFGTELSDFIDGSMPSLQNAAPPTGTGNHSDRATRSGAGVSSRHQGGVSRSLSHGQNLPKDVSGPVSLTFCGIDSWLAIRRAFSGRDFVRVGASGYGQVVWMSGSNPDCNPGRVATIDLQVVGDAGARG